MTLSEIIEGFDKERKNELPLDIKLGWISQLDYKISSEILSDRQSEAFRGYNGTTPLGTVVKAPVEYGEIYVCYLNMKLDYMNGEIGRYNNSVMLFNRMFKEMHDFINRKQKVSKNTKIKAGKLYV